jgi:acetyl-CoA synthetase
MSAFVWNPPRSLFATAKVAALMRQLGCNDAQELVTRTVRDPDELWGLLPEELGVEFDRPWETLLDSSRGLPWTEWYLGGRLNMVKSCLERHAVGSLAGRECLIAEREDGQVTTLTFRELAAEVARCASALAAAGVGAGDRVGALMPMCSGVVVQMLATIKVGAIFIPIFSGYAAPAVAERLAHAEARLLFTADVSLRRGQEVEIEARRERWPPWCPPSSASWWCKGGAKPGLRAAAPRPAIEPRARRVLATAASIAGRPFWRQASSRPQRRASTRWRRR